MLVVRRILSAVIIAVAMWSCLPALLFSQRAGNLTLRGVRPSPSRARQNPRFSEALEKRSHGPSIGVTARGRSLGLLPGTVDLSHLVGQRRMLNAISIPASYDLRTTGRVTAVRDQGVCGSCWTFGTFGSLE